MIMKEEEKEADGLTRIHNVRFYNLTPRSILCMAINDVNKKLALARNDNTLEIWDMRYAPLKEKTIHITQEASVEGIAWSNNRLFTVGLGGYLVEWDLIAFEKKQSQYATGNCIWCLDVNVEGTQLAIGTEEGYINIFDIADDELSYSKLFDRQEGRILCCKYNAEGDQLVTGGVDAIRIWDVKTGHAIHKMTLSRVDMKKEVIVWSLQVLRDMTIVAGDSRGVLSIWDGRSASNLDEHQVLKADMLAVAVNEDEDMIICSGIDPIIRIYAMTKVKKEDVTLRIWVKYRQRNVHDHDVKALVCMGERILSGGMDGYLGISTISGSSTNIVKHGPFLQGSAASIAAEKKLLMLRYPNTVEIWRLGETTGQPDLVAQQIAEKSEKKVNKGDERMNLLVLKQGPKKLVEMKSKDGQAITCSSLSPDGNWLVYSTSSDIRLFSFVAGEEDQVPQLVRVKVVPREFTACRHVLFTDDSSTLFLVKPDNTVNVFNILSNGDIDYSHSFETGKFMKDTILLAQVSKCGNYFVTAGTCRTIAVWKRQGKIFKHHCNLPRYMAPAAAIVIHDRYPRLVAAFSDSKIFEYDFEEMSFTCTEKDYFTKDSETHSVNNIVLDPRNPNVFVLHNDSSLFVLEKCSPEEAHGDNEPKKSKLPVNPDVSGLRLKFQKVYEHFIHLAWLSTNELVAIGVNPVSLLEELPGAFKQKKFGVA